MCAQLHARAGVCQPAIISTTALCICGQIVRPGGTLCDACNSREYRKSPAYKARLKAKRDETQIRQQRRRSGIAMLFDARSAGQSRESVGRDTRGHLVDWVTTLHHLEAANV